MKKRLLLLFAVMLGLMVNGVPLWAQNEKSIIYVSPSGDDSNNGTAPETPVQTVQKALTLVPNGGVVKLTAGEFAGFKVEKDGVTIEGEGEASIIHESTPLYTQSSIVTIAATNVKLEHVSFKNKGTIAGKVIGMFLGGGEIGITGCLFEDQALQTGIYSEPNSTTGNLLIQNCRFNVNDKNLLLSQGRALATVKNNIFTNSDISVAVNDGTNVVESNEFHNCIVKIQGGVKFENNKMYPGEQQYAYSIRPDLFSGTVEMSNNYWGSATPDFAKLIDTGRAPLGKVNMLPYYVDEDLTKKESDYTVSTPEQLRFAVKHAPEKTVIHLKAGQYDFASTLRIDRELSLVGAGAQTRLMPTAGFTKGSGDGGDKYLITVAGQGAKVDLSDFVIDGTAAKDNAQYTGALNVMNATATVSRLTLSNNLGTGMTVNGSDVTARSLTTSGNGWGGVNVGVSSVLADRKPTRFAFDKTSVFGESSTVYVDEKDIPYIDAAGEVCIKVNSPDHYPAQLADKMVWMPNMPIQGNVIAVKSTGDKVADGKLLQQAINCAHSYAAAHGQKISVSVGSGTYQGCFVMLEGVNVTGGDSTVLDGGGNGRVVSQKSAIAKYLGGWQTVYAFTEETVWKNLIIQNGKITDDTKSVYGAGAGAYLSKHGVLSNCTIRDNRTVGTDIKAAGVVLESGGRLETCIVEKNKACDSYAGVLISMDGVVKNSIIRNNEVTSTEHTAGIGTRGDSLSLPAGVKPEAIITDCDIYQNVTNGGGNSGLTLNSVRGTVLAKNTKIHDNRDTNGTKSGVAAGYVATDEGFSISLVNCLVYNNGNLAAPKEGQSQNGIVASSGTSILNCTVWDNAGEHSGIYGVESGNPAITTTNTVAQDYYGDLSRVTPDRHVIRYCLIPTVREFITSEKSLIGAVTSKLFIDSIQGNYSPALGAPYIDKGENGTWKTSDKDLAGNSRIRGGVVDMGAYESGLVVDTDPLTLSTDKSLTSLAYGDTVRMKFNYPEVALADTHNESVSLTILEGDTLLCALKPSAEPFDLAFTCSVDAETKTLLKSVSIARRHLQVKGIEATDRGYDGTRSVALVSTNATLTGGIGEDVALADLAFVGTVAEATAAETKPVAVVATFNDAANSQAPAKAAYYLIDPITDVTVKVSKVALTFPKKEDTGYTMPYGSSLPTFDVGTATGFVGGETTANLGGALTFDCKATASSLAGKYAVVPSGYTSPNYTLTYAVDTLTVAAIAPTVSMISTTVNAAKDKVYVTAKVTNHGGTKMESLRGKIAATKNVKTAFDGTLPVDGEGIFKAELAVESGNAYQLTAAAGVGMLVSTNAEATVNTALNPQTLTIAPLPDKFVYGTAPLSLVASSSVKEATLSYASDNGEVVSVDNKGLVTFGQVGSAILTVTASAEGYMEAVGKLSVTVLPKTLTATATPYLKTYDGTTTAAGLHLVLNGVLDADNAKVAISWNGQSARLATKDAGSEIAIALPALSLTGEASANYQLIQPTGITGTIQKAGAPTVVMQAVSRKYNEEALTYSFALTGLKADESLTTPGLYTGTFAIAEKALGGQYTLTASKVVFKNYESFENEVVASGAVEIEKGTPSVITYNTAAGVRGKVTDDGGYNLKKDEFSASESGVYLIETFDGDKRAVVVYDGGKRAEGNLTADGELNGVEWDITSFKLQSGALAATRADVPQSLALAYGESATVSCTGAGPLYTPDTDLLQLTTQTDGTTLVKAIGVGEAAIFAKASSKATAYLNVSIKRKELTVAPSGFAKTYDGTTVAPGVLTLNGVLANDVVALDLENVSCSFADKHVGEAKPVAISQTLSLVKDEAGRFNNYTVTQPTQLTGKVEAAELTVPANWLSKYYDGTTAIVLQDVSPSGIVSGDKVTITATLGQAGVADDATVVSNTLKMAGNPNYVLATTGQPTSGKILKSTLLANLPVKATGKSDLINRTTFTVQETGVSGLKLSGYDPSYEVSGNTIRVSGGNTANYSVIYATSTVQKGDEPGPSPTPVSGVSLNKNTLAMEPGQTETLIATITPSQATNPATSWTSSDPTIATVDAAGKVTAVKIGKAVVTVCTDDGGYTATCEVNVGHPVGLDEVFAQTKVYALDGALCIAPAAPVDVLVVDVAGRVLFNGPIDHLTRIQVESGVYIVRLGIANARVTTKISVR